MTYDVIYADPPWYYPGSILSTQENAVGLGKSAQGRYPTMKTEKMIQEISPVFDEKANDDAYLVMWVTNSHFPDAISIAEAAGFSWVTMLLVWDKLSPKMGYYTNSQCEYLVLFKRGQPVKAIGKPADTKISQYFGEKRRQHSRKPDGIREIIERLWPEANKLEMFARTSTPGWDVWGNETEKFR